MSAPFGSLDRDTPIPGHICLFHEGRAELRERVAAFVGPALSDPREGIALFGPPGAPEQLGRDLEEDLGVSLDDDALRRRVRLVGSERDADAYLERMREAFDDLISEGVEAVRAVARVVWNATDFPLPEDHLWLESRLNEMFAGRPVVMVCSYDVSELPGAALAYGGLETHPHVIFGDQLAECPRYLEPDRFLTERLLNLRWLTPEPRATH